MNQEMFRPRKLLLTIVGKYSGELVVAASKRGGARGGTKIVGRGLAEFFTGGHHTQEEVTDALIFTLMGEEADGVVREVLLAAREDREHINGLALLFDVTAFIRPEDRMENATNAPERAASEPMGAGGALITCIITHGEADEIMSVAREAGARGGTILNARGTGTEDDVKFFGISLMPEKEMLLIVAGPDHAQAILEAVTGLPVFSEPGGGIVYTTPVEGFFPLGR